jgi:hypothetical protein
MPEASFRGYLVATAPSHETRSTDIAIFGRLLSEHKEQMSPRLARYVLALGFSEADQALMEQLAARNQKAAFPLKSMNFVIGM